MWASLQKSQDFQSIHSNMSIMGEKSPWKSFLPEVTMPDMMTAVMAEASMHSIYHT